MVREGIERHHRVASVAHCLQREGATYVGVAEIQSKNETVAPFIAWRQSHNRRHSADIHLGLATRNMNTFVVSQSMRLSRNRPGYLAAVTGAVAKAGPELMPTFNSHVQMLRELRRFTLTDEQVSHHVVEMMRAKALTIQRLPYIIEDWYNPLYTELLAERNAYRLLHTVAHYYHPEETRGPTAAVLDQSPQLYHYWRTQLDVASL